MVENERSGPIDMLTWTFSRIAMWAPAFIVAIIFYEVVMRYLFFKPTLWVNEMSLWVGGGIYVTAGLYAMQQRSHIRIFIIYDIAPLWLRRIFDFLSVLCVCIFAFAVVWGGFGEAIAKFWRFETFGTAFDPPIPATNKPLILVTLMVLAFQAVSNLIRDWPSVAWVRKIFDAASVLFALWLLSRGLPAVLDMSETGPKLPMGWRVGLAIAMLMAVGLMIYGLVRDFNRTPVPHVENHDPAEEMDLAPDNVLSGNPPRNQEQ